MNTLQKRTELLPSFKSAFSDFFETPIERFFGDKFFNGNAWMKQIPATNISETENDYRVEIAAPGLKRDDFKVTLINGMLNISAEKEEKKEEKDKNYSRQEYNYNSFSRSFYLPDTVMGDKVDAHYEDGVLRIMLPKKAEAKKEFVKEVKVS
ncbi:MAG TPA: Hsp20/alpha crystallin family protein [Chitinophagales bacterium]|nr:Hsp20/alpha crystallin family protein [Chitinophagales bacterium]